MVLRIVGEALLQLPMHNTNNGDDAFSVVGVVPGLCAVASPTNSLVRLLRSPLLVLRLGYVRWLHQQFPRCGCYVLLVKPCCNRQRSTPTMANGDDAFVFDNSQKNLLLAYFAVVGVALSLCAVASPTNSRWVRIVGEALLQLPMLNTNNGDDAFGKDRNY